MGNQRENRSCKPYPDLRRLTRSRSLARVTRSERVTLWWSTRLVSSRRRARSSGALRILASRHLIPGRVGGVITGWDQGCLGMFLGEERELIIPADEGYGAGGFPAWGIPPNGTLNFTIEVLQIKK